MRFLIGILAAISLFGQAFPTPAGGGGVAACPGGDLGGTPPNCTVVGGTHLTSGSAIVGQKFFGAGAPATIAGNLPGDIYIDTTAHNNYYCGAVAGTVAPACTTVSVGGWTLLPTLGTNTYTGSQTVPNANGIISANGFPFYFIASTYLMMGPAAPVTLQLGATNASPALVPSGGVLQFRNGQGNADYPITAIYQTNGNCASSSGACGANIAGAATIAAAATSVVVSDTAVTANSNIVITPDRGLGARLGVTCNTQSSLTLGTPQISARTAATSFTVLLDVAPTTNPYCFSYFLVN